MASELTVVLYINEGDHVPTQRELEDMFDVTVMEYELEEDI